MDTAFCTKCRKQVVIDEEEGITMPNGRAAVKGFCTLCHKPVFKMLPMPQRRKR
jgi:hypothetical protein